MSCYRLRPFIYFIFTYLKPVTIKFCIALIGTTSNLKKSLKIDYVKAQSKQTTFKPLVICPVLTQNGIGVNLTLQLIPAGPSCRSAPACASLCNPKKEQF